MELSTPSLGQFSDVCTRLLHVCQNTPHAVVQRAEVCRVGRRLVFADELHRYASICWDALFLYTIIHLTVGCNHQDALVGENAAAQLAKH